MSQSRIGELLAQQHKMSTHDVQEVLAEQSSTHKPFGQIALSWGLCQPEDLWRAWFEQLGHHSPKVNINKIGVDSRVLSVIPRQLAEQHGLMPLRILRTRCSSPSITLPMRSSSKNSLLPSANR